MFSKLEKQEAPVKINNRNIKLKWEVVFVSFKDSAVPFW